MRISDWSSDVCSSDLGQLEFDRLERRETLAAGLALAPATDRRAVLADARVDDAGVCVLAEEAVHQRPSTIDRELRALLQHVLAHARDDLLVLRVVQHVAHPVGQRDAVGLLVAARGYRGRADAQAGGAEGLLRGVGPGVLVAGALGFAQR